MKGFKIGNLTNLGGSVIRMMNKNLPSILSGFAICGVVATAYTAFKAAPDVKSAIDGKKWDKVDPEVDENTEDVELSAWETVTAAAPYMWKPAVCGVFTVGCIVGAQALNVQRLGVLTLAYKLSEDKLTEYEKKAKEILGDKKAEELHNEAVKGLCNVAPDQKNVIDTRKGDILCFDSWSGRYFTSSEATIRRAESFVNRTITAGEFVSLNDFYDELGLPHAKVGDAFGWQAYTNYRMVPLDVNLSYIAEEVEGGQKAVCVLDYRANFDDRSFCGSV